jgi:hypothetical protein
MPHAVGRSRTSSRAGSHHGGQKTPYPKLLIIFNTRIDHNDLKRRYYENSQRQSQEAALLNGASFAKICQNLVVVFLAVFR